MSPKKRKDTQRPGRWAEQQIKQAFDALGYDTMKYREFESYPEEEKPTHVAVHQHPYADFIGRTKKPRQDWVVYGDLMFSEDKIIAGAVCQVQCKHQDDNGTTDEKVPFVMKTFEARHNVDKYDGAILVLSGVHWTNPGKIDTKGELHGNKGLLMMSWAQREARRISDTTGMFCKVVHGNHLGVFIREHFRIVSDRSSPVVLAERGHIVSPGTERHLF